MKAALLYGKEDMRLEERPIPEINDNEVLVRIKSAAICGTDVRMYRNGVKNVDENHPLIIGHEMAGVIEKVGKNVTAYTPGTRVAVAPNMGCGICDDCIRGNSHMCKDYRALGVTIDGGFAEYVKVPEAAVRAGNLIPMEDHVSFAEAAITEALSCVYNGSQQCNIRPGDYALIIGAGATKVIINDIAENRLELCKEIDPSFITVKDDVINFVMKETKGHGVDAVITACPVPAAQQTALEVAANYGRICFFGGLPEDRKMVPLNTNLIHYKQLICTGTTRASLRQFKESLGFVSAGIINVKKLITAEFPLAEIDKGFEKAIAAEGLKNVINMD